MSVTVRIPTPLRKLTNNQMTVQAEGETLRGVLDHLEAQYPGLKERLLDEEGELRRYVNVFINDTDVRFEQGLDTPVADGDEVAIVPAIAGG
ncbi:MAG TPA: MoaD/ThiS family protein [Armatimonadetes bacterium]|nr:MoaD/ThiS family protein [Armatimonadota bacterium]